VTYETIKLEDLAPGVAAVVFNRPDVANALSTQMGHELLDAWTTLGARADLRCVILRGEGKHFQAGADLRERNGMTDEAWAAQHKVFEDFGQAQLACPVPVIAAVQGAAMGGGWLATSHTPLKARGSDCPKRAWGSCRAWAAPSC
jgi:enoyl-CoA hydratase